MDGISMSSERVNEEEADGYEIEEGVDMGVNDGVSSVEIQGENPIAPAVGMEFETYEDVYYFYNCYAKDQGFGVRVCNTWYRKDREKYRRKLSCSSAGYKRRSEANRPRPETRTGCPVMIKFRLMESCRWRVIEVELEHNHLISPVSGKFYKSHKEIGSGSRRGSLEEGAEEVPKTRLFRTVVVDAVCNGKADAHAEDVDKRVWGHKFNQLNFREGDAQAVNGFLCRSQLNDPEFFHVMDHNENGTMRNVFWADGRCRCAFSYFGDVVAIDTMCLTKKYAVPLVVFFGLNHHGQSIIFGCGLLAGETADSYIWLFRTWLTLLLGHPPRTVITNRCNILQEAVAEVFPKASHFFSLVHMMESYPLRFRGLFDSDAIRLDFNTAVYSSVKVEEFEKAWEHLTKRFGLLESNWFKTFYEDRKRCVPVYVKDTFLAGLFPIHHTDLVPLLLFGHIHDQTSFAEFFVKYDDVIQTMHHMETTANIDSRNSSCVLRLRCPFELQVSKMYTSTLFKRFQDELGAMYSCSSTRQMNDSGSTETYILKEHLGVNKSEAREFEVSYNPSKGDVHCICGLFNLKGYLCRHALHVLSQCGLVEIPSQYMLSRWRKDIKRTYVADHGHGHGSVHMDVSNPVNRHDHLYKRLVQIAEEGCKSQERYKLTLQLLDDMMSRAKMAQDNQHTIITRNGCLPNAEIMHISCLDNKQDLANVAPRIKEWQEISLNKKYGNTTFSTKT